VSKKLAKGMAAVHRTTIQYYFEHILGSPLEDKWLEYGVVLTIMKQVQVPAGSTDAVKTVLRDILKAQELGKRHNVRAGCQKRGRTPLIEELSPAAQVVYEALENGLSTTQTAVLLNEWRAAQTPVQESVSWSAVERFIQASDVINRSRRATKKSGKDDEGSTWAKARKAECVQFKRQLELGDMLPGCAEVTDSPFPPLTVYQIAWWDENHKKVILGHTSKFENRISRNTFDKTPTPLQYGGVLPAKSKKTAMKFPPEARGCFGCAVVRDADGTCRGEKAVPFNYTGKWVVGRKAWVQAQQAEMARVLPLAKPWGLPGSGYKERYGDDWEKMVNAVLTRGNKTRHALVCVTDLIDHVVVESTRIYASSAHANDFILFHDGLSQWWEKEAQEYIGQLGFKDRQLRCMGQTNSDNRYAGKVCGDSPEICRGLDAHGFADLKLSMAFHTSLSSKYEFDDPRRFGMGTPAEVWRTMCRCWEMEPTSARIVEDVLQFGMVLEKIIAAEGCVVPDEFLRNGRRGRSSNGKFDLKNKPVQKQRKNTMHARPCHPDCFEARRRIKAAGAPAAAYVRDAAEGLLLLLQGPDKAPLHMEDAEDDAGEDGEI
jgi:hypothetical protein